MKFLILDNNQDDRELIKQGFRKEFYGLEFLDVIKREDFDEAIGRGDFDVVITDRLLNWTDGLWILRTIKNRYPYVPVIMLTNNGSEEIAVEGMKSGLSDYLTKKHMHRLPGVVKESLKKAGLDREHTVVNKQSTVSQKRYRAESIAGYAYTFRVEPDGTLSYECVTEAFAFITGYTFEEVNARGGWHSLIYPDDIPVFSQHHNRLFSGQSNISKFRIITKSGGILWLRDYAHPVWGEAQGRVIHIYGSAEDVTASEQDNEIFRDVEAKYRNLLDTTNDAIFITDAESGIIIDANKRAEDLFGYLREEIIGIHHTQFYQEEEILHYTRTREDHDKTVNFFTKDLYVQHKNGHKIPVEIHASVTFSGNKKIVQSVFRDVTERKRAEENIRLYAEILNNIQIGLIVWHLENPDDVKTYTLVAANTAAMQFTGLAAGNLIGKTIAEIFPDLIMTEVPKIYAEVVRSGKVKDLKEDHFIDKGNLNGAFSVRAFPLSNNCVGTAFVDITENEKTNEELKIFKMLFSEIRDLAYICDTQGNILYVNKIFEKLTGHKPEEFFGKSFAPLFDEENLEKAKDIHVRAAKGESLQFELSFKDTGTICEYRNFHLRDGKGNIIRTIGIARDVTKRKRLEKTLHESHEHVISILNGLNAVVYVADMKIYEILYANKYLQDMFGDLEGKICWQALQANQSNQCSFCTNDKLLDTDGNPTGIYSWEFQNTVNKRWYLISDKAMKWGDGRIVRLEIAIDITERKRIHAIDTLLHEIDQLVLQGQAEDFILPYICTRLIDIFSYPLIWIGIKEEDGTVGISAQAGTHVAYLNDLKVRWGSTPENECIIGLAIRTGKTQAIDTQEPMLQLCHKRAYQYGLQSFVVVPLSAKNMVLGTLNLYALTSNAFDTETVRLLENLAVRISVTLLIAKDQQQLRLHSAAMAAVASAVFITDSGGQITWINEAFIKLSGYTREDVHGHTPRLFKSGKYESSFYQQIWQTLIEGKVWQGEIINRHKEGSFYIVNQTITPLLDNAGKVRYFVAIHEDITDKKAFEERIIHMAHYDTLTNLPNRILFRDRLQQEMIHARRNKRLTAIIFLDLDRFKIINDTLGHAFGDLVLHALAERLRSCVREGDTVSRIGGDEFTFIIPDIEHPQDAALIAQKIVNAMSPSFQLGGREIHVTPSLGIAIYPLDAEDAENLIKKADIAMYQAKEHGGDTFKFYMEDMNIDSLERLALENDLRKALKRSEMLVYYQPLVDQSTGQIMSVEALARWQHPNLGMIYPAKFIPIAEETGLILPIGEWVLMTACSQAKAWHDEGFSTLRITVNLSVRQFKQQNFVNTVTRVLQATGLDPRLLELELTEGIVMQNSMEVLATLQELKALGISLSIDDFGIEYSSLSYLKRFPIDTIKIDRSFIRDIAINQDDAAIVTAIIAVAESLKLKVVAEGVENKDQAAFLRELHCNNIQGYLYSRPLAAIDMGLLLQKGTILNIENE